ncbi:unnamed protein product [Paramecium sonneborni]|uniref:RAP domain-containing protein n=1 Tax=Paramecium sonneborni TaxID=65129 RepID=A0A8S1KXA2_9CILI|nr:unnamed protein product [Paramecium sonneborni]
MLRFVVKYGFHEKTFINSFLSASVKSQLHLELKENINQVQNLNTLIGVIDTSYKTNQIIPLDLLKLVLQRSTELVQVESNLEYLKGLLLTLSINRIENRQLNQTILDVVMQNYQKLSDEHLITITETIIYNKLNQKYKIKDIQILFEQMAINLQNSDSQLYNQQILLQLPKLINLSQHIRHNKLIHEILATVYGLLHQLKQFYNQELNAEYLSLSLQMCQIMDTLEILFQNPLIVSAQKKQQKKLQQQFMDLINQSFTEKNMIETQFSVQHINSILNFVKKYPKSPPISIPTQIHNLIGNIYISLINEYTTNQKQKILKTLVDYNSLAYFLTKTSKNFYLQDQDYKVIHHLVETESNLFILAKTLETISTNVQNHNDLHHNPNNRNHQHHHHDHPKLRDSVLQLIESKIRQLMQNHLNPSDSLVIAFQSLVKIEDYTPKLAALLEYFAYGQVLNQLKWIDFIVKFIPSLGILSKRLTQQFYMSVQQNNSDQFKQLSDVWGKVLTVLMKKIDQLEPNKIPIILFYLSQASKLDLKDVSTLLHIIKKSTDFSKFNIQQICEIFYSFSRLNYQDTQFYFDLINKLVDKEMTMDQVILVYSGLIINKLYNQTFISQLQDQLKIKDFNEKNMLSYLQSLLTLQFQPKSTIMDSITTQFYKSKNSEFIVGCATSLLQYHYDQKILEYYNNFLKNQNELYIKSPFYAHQLHVLFMKLKHVDQVNQDFLQDIIKVLQESKISLAKYHLQMKQITRSQMELEIIDQFKNILDFEKLEKQAQLNEYKFADQYDPIEIPKIENLIPYQIDFKVGDYCFEINGPKHYLQIWPEQQFKLDGWTMKKKQLLESIGFKYIEINHEQYRQKGFEYLKQFQSI